MYETRGDFIDSTRRIYDVDALKMKGLFYVEFELRAQYGINSRRRDIVQQRLISTVFPS